MRDLKSIFETHVALTSDEPIGLSIARADGPFLILEDGRQVIDFISGIAVSSLGHRHPAVIKAIQDQLDKHLHVMVYGEFIQRPQVCFAELLAASLPDSLQVVYFCNSGTEANEGALKLAKKFTGRHKLVAFDQSYHGDTHGSLSVTGRDVYRNPFAPLLPEVAFLPFDDIPALQEIDTEVACVIAEPVQGEGGIRVPDSRWMSALRARCTEAGALLVFDEIQTGFGRTGSLFAFEQFGVVPDILTMAKAMGGGMPLGAFVSSAEIMAVLRKDPPLSHVTTFGGHPVSCAAGHTALRVLLDENLIERAVVLGQHIRTRLVHPLVNEVRGKGCMLGMEVSNKEVARRLVKGCLDDGLLLGWTLHSNTLIRLAPPLNISLEIVDRAIESILSNLDKVSKTTVTEKAN